MASARILLLAALVPGCTRAAGTAEGDSEPAPERSPPSEATVTAEDIARTPGLPIEEVLMSRFPGVVVTRSAGGGIAIRIRGTMSIRGSTEPLYVIDGVPIRPGPGGSLSGINPHDIETIEVLTDPADTAMYGVRGGNGVVVVTTKQPDQ